VPSRNKPLAGLFEHKKHHSLKLSSQKHKFKPNEEYHYERVSIEAEVGSPEQELGENIKQLI